jgi:UDP-2-acetamido-2-deoxy-ribo-hexuluronate aminotransferase
VPFISESYYSSFAQYTIKLQNKEQRDGLQAALKKEGIPTAVYYQKPMHRQEAFSGLVINDNDYPVTNRLCETVLSLPMHPYLSLAELGRLHAVFSQYKVDKLR